MIRAHRDHPHTPPAMPSLRLPLLLAAALLVPGVAPSTTTPPPAVAAPDATDDSLAAAIRRHAERLGARIGVAALHLETGARFALDADRGVFMASVVKLPIAVQLLDRVDRGELRLDTTLTLRPRDLRVGPAGIAHDHPNGGTFTVAELLRRAVAESDNTASDALLRYSGGPAAVTAALRRLGIEGIRVDRSYAENTFEWAGLQTPPPEETWTPALIDSVTDAVPAAVRDPAAERFRADARDRATAGALVELLARLARGELLSPTSRALLFSHLADNHNPATRILPGVPAGARVAHKTGTWGPRHDRWVAVSDAGIVTLPAGRGRIALAILVEGSTGPLARTDSAMADITRLIVARMSTGAATARADTVGATRELAPDVRVSRLAPGVWLHVTTAQLPFGPYPSNGLLLETDDGAVLFDTAWDDRQTGLLLAWAATELGRPVRRAVATHFHDDRLGGLGALRAAGVRALASGATVRLARAAGGSAPDSVPGLAERPYVDDAGFELFHPGAGHTVDNIVVWLPAQRVLHGGCLVKPDTATTVGNVADADVRAWPATVARVRARYPHAAVVVPGHGAVGGPSALDATEALVRAKGEAAVQALRHRRGG